MSLIGTGKPIGRPSDSGKDKSADSSVLTLMRQRYEHVCSVDSENRESYIENVRISSSADQWDEEVKKRRGKNRPALTFNLLNLVVKQIIGDYRQNKMAIKVLPSGGPATEDVADILGGIIRNIEADSHADQAYTNALECSSRGNIGYFRVITEYEADDVFNQKLIIAPIQNPLTVHCDPAAKKLTREDAQYYIITEMMPKTEFRRMYPEAEENGWDLVDIDSDDGSDWGDDEQIRVCEYYTKETVTERLVAFDNGSVIVIDSDDEIEALKQIGINPVKERQADRTNIKWRKCTGSNILEERDYKTKYIPIIPVLGEEVNLEGKSCLRSAIYYAIDAQHSYNYERSTSVERSALGAKAPWIVTQKQIEAYRDQWDNANNTPQPYLVHMPDPQMPSGPQRIEPPAPSVADMQNAQTAAQDIQRTTGIFDSQLGAKSNVLSGVGLSEQQSQGATSTFIFLDNLRAGIEFCGRILIDWIPQVYDTERVVRTINTEDDIEMQTLNQKQANPLMGITEVLNDITVGKYDIVVTAGKAFASRRQEAVDGLLTWAKAFPQQAPMVADKVLQAMDVPGGEVMAERVKRSLPPAVVNDPDSPEGQQAAQQQQQAQAAQQAQQQKLVEAHIQTEQGKQQAEMAKSQASVVKSQAEVIKAKADVIQAQEQTRMHKVDAGMQVLDAHRQASEPMESAPARPTARTYGNRKADIEESRLKDEEDMRNSEEIKGIVGGLANHVVSSSQAQQQHNDALHKILGHLVDSHHKVAQAMEHQNRIASAPTVAERDKSGRIIGSRKSL